MNPELIGSCTCMTKTPDVKFHSEHCAYRRRIEDAVCLVRESYCPDCGADRAQCCCPTEAELTEKIRLAAGRFGQHERNPDDQLTPLEVELKDALEWCVLALRNAPDDLGGINRINVMQAAKNALARVGYDNPADAPPDLLSVAQRWVALDCSDWHPVRHATEKAELIRDTRAAIAKATAA